MPPEELQSRLLDLQDVGYREFHLKTCPQAQHVIGVRVPELRRLAKEITKGDFWQFLDTVQPHYYEELLVTGVVIATAPIGLAERLDYTAWFVPQINNWAICDTFCASFKPKPQDLPVLWDFILQYRKSNQEYELRFMLVMALNHFILPDYLPQIFDSLDEIKSDKYYVEMAKAWLVAEIFTKFREEAIDYLQRDQLSVFAHNKAIQKARESRQVTDADKQLLLSMKL